MSADIELIIDYLNDPLFLYQLELLSLFSIEITKPIMKSLNQVSSFENYSNQLYNILENTIPSIIKKLKQTNTYKTGSKMQKKLMEKILNQFESFVSTKINQYCQNFIFLDDDFNENIEILLFQIDKLKEFNLELKFIF